VESAYAAGTGYIRRSMSGDKILSQMIPRHPFNYGTLERQPWGWDYMFVFNADDNPDDRARIVTRLLQAGFRVSQAKSQDNTTYLLRFSLPTSILKRNAEIFEYMLKLKDEFGGGYLAYASERDTCYINSSREAEDGSYFTSAERIELLLRTLASKLSIGCDLDVRKEILEGKMADALAIHDVKERDALVREAVWHQWWNLVWTPPFHRMRHYFGSRVGLYFVFVSYLNKMTWSCAGVGIFLFILYVSKFSEVTNAGIHTAFGFFVALWITVVAEFWKRESFRINSEWGTNDMEIDSSDDLRPQYKGELKPGYYDRGGFVSLSRELEAASMDPEGGSAIPASEIPSNPHTPAIESRKMLWISGTLTGVFSLVAGGLTFVLLFFRQKIIGSIQDSGTPLNRWALIIPGILNGILITVLDGVWKNISLKLTDAENHRSSQAYNDSLAYKRFAFQCFSNYTSLFYIAFVRPFLNDGGFSECGHGWVSFDDHPDCLGELEIQLTTLLLTRITISQVMEALLPILQHSVKVVFAQRSLRRNRETSATLSRYSAEMKLPAYHLTTEDFGEVVLLLGYLALFGAAFPLTPLFMLINNLIEVRSDAYKILLGHRRIDADQANEIGAWYYIIEIIGYAAVPINAGLLIFTSNSLSLMFNGITFQDKILAFFCIENILVLFKLLIRALIPDESAETLKKASRQRFYIAKFFKVNEKASYRAHPMLKSNDALYNQVRDVIDDCEELSEGESSEIQLHTEINQATSRPSDDDGMEETYLSAGS